MATLRFKAIEESMKHKPVSVPSPSEKISDFFGIYVFDKSKMLKYLSSDAYEAVMDAIVQGTRIDRKMADQVASGMKTWAMSHGVTHYTHWFQPLTEGTAEKHDTFVEIAADGSAIEQFSGKLLAQQEPDASSFPSGGIRNTFEARGYTAWDPTSPAFIMENTLIIPTIFISYTGEALDYKTPMLKALHALDKAAVEVCQYFDKDVTKVISNLGWEQEYFLVDEAVYNARPDLILTGRTLMGHASAKNQQLEDQYFGQIPNRVLNFMKELEFEAYKLGIPVKTRHNEVAPNQYELAPIYEETNLAIDHNLLIMQLMRTVSRKHNFIVLLHEKPFSGINGSGKHNNWSVATNTGVNLLSPGKTPKSNLQFLTFLINTLAALYKHNALIKASIASAGNQHRLGANEAPPAIISAFLGQQLNKMLDEIETRVTDEKMTPDEKTVIKLDIGKIPEILLDNTDRNRTSPFAFTGNKFEFRAVGSSANCASAMTALNAALAEQLVEFKKQVDELIEKGVKKDEAILQLLRKLIKASKAIRFEGNGYSEEWKAEAAKRGLDCEASVPKMYHAYLTEQSRELFRKTNVFTDVEMEARSEVRMELFIKKIQIEARVLSDLTVNHILPTVVEYQSRLIENVNGLKSLYSAEDFKALSGRRLAQIKDISLAVETVEKLVSEMVEARKAANRIDDVDERAIAYSDKVFPFLEEIRYHVDKLELIVDNERWPLPKYRELLFIR
ncbi:MAG: glutamine synthetase III [Bacteroidales bacterium]|nr:glutamine synthetase III [Bacteroidales bacterium]